MEAADELAEQPRAELRGRGHRQRLSSRASRNSGTSVAQKYDASERPAVPDLDRGERPRRADPERHAGGRRGRRRAPPCSCAGGRRVGWPPLDREALDRDLLARDAVAEDEVAASVDHRLAVDTVGWSPRARSQKARCSGLSHPAARRAIVGDGVGHGGYLTAPAAARPRPGAQSAAARPR